MNEFCFTVRPNASCEPASLRACEPVSLRVNTVRILVMKTVELHQMVLSPMDARRHVQEGALAPSVNVVKYLCAVIVTAKRSDEFTTCRRLGFWGCALKPPPKIHPWTPLGLLSPECYDPKFAHPWKKILRVSMPSAFHWARHDLYVDISDRCVEESDGTRKRLTVEKSCVCSYNADPVLSGGLSAFSSEPDETSKDGYKEQL